MQNPSGNSIEMASLQKPTGSQGSPASSSSVTLPVVPTAPVETRETNNTFNPADSDETIVVSSPGSTPWSILEERPDIQRQLVKFASDSLSDCTDLNTLFLRDVSADEISNAANAKKRKFKRKQLDEEALNTLFGKQVKDGLQIILIPKRTTSDRRRLLQITPSALNTLIRNLSLSPEFLGAICQMPQPCGTAFRRLSAHVWDYWMLIPIRVRTKCHKKEIDLVHQGPKDKYQMDPNNLLHLEEVGEDVRGFHVALYLRRDDEARLSTVTVVSFLSDRWQYLDDMPVKRLENQVKGRRGGTAGDGLWVVFAYLNVVMDWWNDVLLVFDDQLLREENTLQAELENLNDLDSTKSRAAMNKRLHIMAAHLHRYGTELARTKDMVGEISDINDGLKPQSDASPEEMQSWEHARYEILYMLSQCNTIIHSRDELERKTKNILALLFNNMQVINDRTMQNILEATQKETKHSQVLAKSMKEDSIAMKTIAVLTMFFLPGTSFAAILSMPFFNENKWLQSAARFWIWFALTVPSTGIAFVIYMNVLRRARRQYRLLPEDDIESQETLTPIKTNGRAALGANDATKQRPQ